MQAQVVCEQANGFQELSVSLTQPTRLGGVSATFVPKTTGARCSHVFGFRKITRFTQQRTRKGSGAVSSGPPFGKVVPQELL